MFLTAPWIIQSPTSILQNGWIQIEDDRIVAMGSGEPKLPNPPSVHALPNSILLPGLINAHCHLEHSALYQQTTPGLSFTQWVMQVSALSEKLSADEVSHALKVATDYLIRGGSTTVIDHTHPNTPVFETPFDRIPVWEVLGSDQKRANESFSQALEKKKNRASFISPHSLYAVHPQTLQKIFASRSSDSYLSVHCLESGDENEFFRKHRGPLAEYVRERGGEGIFSALSPIEWLEAHGVLNEHTVLIHGNYLTESEIDFLAKKRVGLVHCPGSHCFFKHQNFPWSKILKSGIRVGLGTDSLASNAELSMLSEMRLLQETEPQLTPQQIFSFATLEGARLFGIDREVGSLEPGKKANLIAVPIVDPKSDLFENILEARAIEFGMVSGKVVWNSATQRS